MCTVLLPPGVNPTAVNKYINIKILPETLLEFPSYVILETLEFPSYVILETLEFPSYVLIMMMMKMINIGFKPLRSRCT